MGAEPSAVEWLRRLDARELSARELAEHYLRLLDGAALLNAVVVVDPDRVLAEASETDRFRHEGQPMSLLGLPVTVKDNLDVAGYPTAAGSAGAFAAAGTDATVVRRLRAAGAIVLAKTNVPEASSSYETDNAATGRTNHPIDPARTPGGSSGGETALLGADASPVGVGTDGGGSIRVPAHYCGLIGLRPTVGRTPETGQQPPTRATGMMDLSCVGPIARTVADAALLLRVICGSDGIDPYAPPMPPPELGQLRCPRTLRIGFWTCDPTVPHTTGPTQAAIRTAAAAFDRPGWSVEEIAAPCEPAANELFFAALAADGGAHLLERLGTTPRPHHPQFSALLTQLDASPPTASEIFTVQRRIFALRSRMRALAERYDLLLSPVVAGPAPRHGEAPGDRNGSGPSDYSAFHYVHVIALAGLPAATVPVATESGLPIGVQIIAAPFREDMVLAAAQHLEGVFGGFTLTRGLRRAATA